MNEKLEFKVLVYCIVLLVVGVLLAAGVSLWIERLDVYAVSKERLQTTAKVITKAIEGSMVEANVDVTRALLDELKTVSGFELHVYNNQSKEAFVFRPDATPEEDPMLNTVLSTGLEKFNFRKDLLVAYIPLPNQPKCQSCHFNEGEVIGGLKITISLEKELERIRGFAVLLLFGSVLGIIFLSVVLWRILRVHVISPLKSLEVSAQRMAEGDLSFNSEIDTNDEIGRLDRSIKSSLLSISGIIKRVSDISSRTLRTAEYVEKESDRIVENTLVEAESVAEISSSIEELNAAISEIADSSQNLARAVQDTAASMEEMTVTISSLKEITHEVSEGVETTSSSIEQLSATIKEVQENAEDLDRVSDETLAAIEEITSSVKAVESKAKESSALSQKVTSDASDLGVSAINRTVTGMQNIKQSVSRAAEVIQRLGGRSEEIGSILTVIDDITDQTTLLALNAAILAAQAGEHGKGFSVVANEIKDLAERTALSTQEIDNLIKTVRKEVQEAVMTMDDGMNSVEEGISLSKESASALRKMLDSSRQSAEMSTSIEYTTTEQAKTARYVSESIDRVRLMVKEIVKATSEQAKGVSLIIEASERIREASKKADGATEQQAAGTKQMSRVLENISDMSMQISRAINEQKMGSRQIWSSAEKIKDIPDMNRELSFGVNKSLRELSRDSELINLEMTRFKVYEERHTSVLRLGIVPFDAPAQLFQRFTPLAEHLTKVLGKRVELKVASDFKTAVRDIESGATSFCFMTSLTYLEARQASGAEVVVQTLRSGKPYHHSVIVVRDDSTIREVVDLKSRSMAFVDIQSASGYLVPSAMLQREGITLERLSYYNFLGYHDDVIRAVLKRDFDAGGVMESSLERFADQGLRVVARSEEIPEFNITAAPDVSGAERKVMREALLGLSVEKHADILRSIDPGITGFTEASDVQYEGIRKLLKEFGS